MPLTFTIVQYIMALSSCSCVGADVMECVLWAVLTSALQKNKQLSVEQEKTAVSESCETGIEEIYTLFFSVT